MNIRQPNIELLAHVFVSTSIVHCIHYSRILSRMFTTWLNPLVRPRLHVMKNLCYGLDIILMIYVEFRVIKFRSFIIFFCIYSI